MAGWSFYPGTDSANVTVKVAYRANEKGFDVPRPLACYSPQYASASVIVRSRLQQVADLILRVKSNTADAGVRDTKALGSFVQKLL